MQTHSNRLSPTRVRGMCDKHQFVEEPDARKRACPVLKTSGGGDKPAEFNLLYAPEIR